MTFSDDRKTSIITLYRLDIWWLDIYRMMMRLSYYYFFRRHRSFLMSTIIKFIQHVTTFMCYLKAKYFSCAIFSNLTWLVDIIWVFVNFNIPVYTIWFSCCQRLWNYLTFQSVDFERIWWRFLQIYLRFYCIKCTCLLTLFSLIPQKTSVKTSKEVIRNRRPKDQQHNGHIGQEDKQWKTKHYKKYRQSNAISTNSRWWTQVLRKVDCSCWCSGTCSCYWIHL